MWAYKFIFYNIFIRRPRFKNKIPSFFFSSCFLPCNYYIKIDKNNQQIALVTSAICWLFLSISILFYYVIWANNLINA